MLHASVNEANFYRQSYIFKERYNDQMQQYYYV